jgi:hypothetical protein
MKLIQATVLACVVFFSAPALADQASEAAAERLLVVMDMESAMDHVVDAAIDAQIQQKPELAPFRKVMRDFFSKYMSYQALKPQLVDAYASEFTAAELDQASDFYSTPTGKKFMEKMPALMAKGAQIGTQAVQAHVPELQAAIQAEAQRLQALQQQAPQEQAPSAQASPADPAGN